MEKRKAGESTESVTNCLRNLQLNNTTVKSKSTQNPLALGLQSQFWVSNKGKNPPSLLSLCLGVVGSNLEDITDDLAEISLTFPSDIKLVLVAIARRRKLLNDDLVIALADSSWERLDISGSDVSDSGLCHIVNICQNLRVVDIRGCPRSEKNAIRCLSLLKPYLNNVDGESWEELDAAELTHGSQSLRWLIWPKIDKDSLEMLTMECPRIVVNPKPSILGFRGTEVPREALSDFVLDDPIVEDINPKTWAVSGVNKSRTAFLPVATPDELSMAEKFRLAFVERDTRLAPKRAKNARQHQRRAQREWVTSDARAKALALASKATKSVNHKNL